MDPDPQVQRARLLRLLSVIAWSSAVFAAACVVGIALGVRTLLPIAALTAAFLVASFRARSLARAVRVGDAALLEATEKVRRSREDLDRLFTLSLDLICVSGFDGTLRRANPAFHRALGYAPDEELPRSWREIVHPEDYAAGERVRERVREGEALLRIENRCRTRTGGWRRISWSAVPAAGNIYAIGRDVTDQRRMEESLLLSDRMASVGTLASGIAHEVNNPLAFVITNLAVVARELPILFPGHAGEEPWDDLLAAISDAREGADRVRTIVRDLRSFSRPESPEIVPVDLHACLDGAASLASNEIRHHARLVKRYAEALPLALGNPGRLGQVFVNLLINAAQAIETADPEREEIRIVTLAAGADRVAVEIHDTGSGIPDEVRPRLFDPFFTTKPVGVGTGLGLSICHSIVTSFGGEIEVESAPEKGTIFRVLLPQAGSPAEFPQSKTG